MDAHRWRRIEAIFADALEKTPEARDAFLNGACADDSAMRSELSSLLEAHRRNGSFLEASTRRSRGEDTQAHVPLTAGARLGAFEIVAPIGSGGMGTVYHARDTRLERAVPLKFPLYAGLEGPIDVGAELLARRQPNRLRQLSRGDAVVQQNRWHE